MHVRTALGAALGCTLTLLAPAASAFCGFYVSGADAAIYNHATQVVLMRDGLRTVLSMENNYEGPADKFAMVVPVPIVLQKENVKILSQEMFDHIDKLDAPRLVEYWERDPCAKDDYGYEFSDDPLTAGGFGPNDATIRVRPGPVQVQVLNRFVEGEYQIVILGAEDSGALETWLRQNGYRIPKGAEAALRPYVQAGMKFFVAKVDPSKIKMKNGMATLSPLRFYYDTDTFSLPIRLGLLSSSGVQDLIMHILARGHRYEVANYVNIFIPTNLDVKDAAKTQFGAFYVALYDHALQGRPQAVMTEYSWDAGGCDPCPTPPLEIDDLGAFGADVLPKSDADYQPSFVLTRLHARYDKASLGADLIFKEGPAIRGGREVADGNGKLEEGAQPDSMNNFQARYTLRHPWGGPIQCKEPLRGRWGLSGTEPAPAEAAQDLAFAPRGSVDLASFLGQGSPDMGTGRRRFPLPAPLPPQSHDGGCAGCRVGSGEAGSFAALAAALLGALAFVRRRRR